ncbi:MAG: hypothetical protein KatS3mg016_2314 [Fimbriimonadales bacterium]|nr:MAG: hypothetical protein KatS3mg016_2314 [Fimbriimonadales bacterium]
MRRWATWILALGVAVGLVALGTLWFQRSRIEPIDPPKLVQLSEQERVEWLIAQILARSRSGALKWKIQSLLGFDSERGGYLLRSYDVDTVAQACRRYNLEDWMRRLPPYVMDSAQFSLLKNQALWHIQRGDLRTAEAILQRIPWDTGYRESVLACLAVAQAQRGDRANARKTLQQLPFGFSVLSSAMRRLRVAEDLLQAGMLDEVAESCTQESIAVPMNLEIPQSVLNAYLRAGRWNDALRWARRLPEGWREFALTEWATHALQRGDPDPTRHLNRQEQTPALLLRLAHIAQTHNMHQQARRWRNAAFQRLKSPATREQTVLLFSAATELARIGDYAQAENLIKQIQPNSLRRLAARQASFNAMERGDLNQAQRFANLIDSLHARIPVEAHIAARYYRAGETAKAQSLIDRLVQQLLIKRRTDPVLYEMGITRGICRSVIEENAYPLVQPLMRQLEGEIAKMPRGGSRSAMLNELIAGYIKAGDLESAFRLAAQERPPKEQAPALLMILESLITER